MNAHPRIATYTCPCCKGVLGEAAPIETVIEAETAPKRKAILKALAAPVGKTVSRDDLMTVVFPTFQPAEPKRVFHIHLRRTRQKAEEFGWMIKSEGYRGTTYRLLPIGGDR